VSDLTLIEDTIKWEGELCLGVLSGIYWQTSPDLWERLEKGFDLIPGKLLLRIFTEKDKELFTSISPSFKLETEFGQKKNTVLEIKKCSMKELFVEEFNPLSNALLAFRLLKDGGIFLDCVYALEGGLMRRIIHSPKPGFFSAYDFSLDEIDNLIAIIQKVQTVDFDMYSSLRMACTRFGRSYLDRFDEDKLIDLCIAFEALFLKGEYQKSELGMGQVIGLACSMLLGRDNAERTDIKNNIESGFSLRNKVVHGYEIDTKKFNRIIEILPEFENNLRRSIHQML
jgi:hypothetical protein